MTQTALVLGNVLDIKQHYYYFGAGLSAQTIMSSIDSRLTSDD